MGGRFGDGEDGVGGGGIWGGRWGVGVAVGGGVVETEGEVARGVEDAVLGCGADEGRVGFGERGVGCVDVGAGVVHLLAAERGEVVGAEGVVVVCEEGVGACESGCGGCGVEFGD